MLFGVSEYIIIEERDEHAEGGERHERQHVESHIVECQTVNHTSYGTQTRRKTVNCVNQVNGIYQEYDYNCRERICNPYWPFMDSQDAEKIRKRFSACYQKNGADYLNHELCPVLYADKVIRHTYKIKELQCAERAEQ